MARTPILLLLLGMHLCALGCATTPPDAAGLLPPPPLPPGDGDTTNVVVPRRLDVNVYKNNGSIIDFLGIPQIERGICGIGAGIIRLGQILFPNAATNFSQFEPGDPIVAIDDPANLDSDSPAIQGAAKIKQDENQAQQKIKAINYLTDVGCGGCYPDVEDAFLAALDDCTETVRYAAVNGLKTAAGKPCTFCSHKSCCSPKIRKKLLEMSDAGDCLDCSGEPSARVRRVARIALANCGQKGLRPDDDEVAPEDIEGPTQLPPEPQPEPDPANEAPPVSRRNRAGRVNLANHRLSQPVESRRPDLSSRHQAEADIVASQMMEEIDPAVFFEEERDVAQRASAADIQSRTELATFINGILSEMSEERTSAPEPQQSTTPVQPATAVVAENGSLGADLPTTTGPAASATVNRRARPAPANSSASHSASTRETDGATVRWESITWISHNAELLPQAMQEMRKLQALLQANRAIDPNDKFLRQIKIETNDWTPLAAIKHADKRQLLKSLAIGEISRVIVTDAGLEIIRVLQRRPNSATP